MNEKVNTEESGMDGEMPARGQDIDIDELVPLQKRTINFHANNGGTTG